MWQTCLASRYSAEEDLNHFFANADDAALCALGERAACYSSGSTRPPAQLAGDQRRWLAVLPLEQLSDRQSAVALDRELQISLAAGTDAASRCCACTCTREHQADVKSMDSAVGASFCATLFQSCPRSGEKS